MGSGSKIPVMNIHNYQPSSSIKMMIIKLDPQFEGTAEADPVNRLIFTHARRIAGEMDLFIRSCIGRVLDEFSLQVFIDTLAPIPGMDIEMCFISPQRCRVAVIFKGKTLGTAMFDSVMEGEKLVTKISQQEYAKEEKEVLPTKRNNRGDEGDMVLT